MATKKENLKGMKRDELEKKLAVIREELRSIRFKAEGAKSKNVKAGASLKKQIARLLTEMKTASKVSK